MRSFASAVLLLAASTMAQCSTLMTFNGADGQTGEYSAGDAQWWNITGFYDFSADTVTIKSDSSEVAACYFVANNQPLENNKWIRYNPVTPDQELGYKVDYVWCQGDFEVPTFITDNALVSD